MAFPLSKLLDDVVRLCPLPATTKKVIDLAESDRSSIAQIVQAVSSDPALATGILRLANSALYAGMKVSQLDAAILRIGMRELKDLVSTMSVLASFRSKDPVQASLHERSALAGAIANRVAKVTKLNTPGIATTCGLLCEVGAMACLAADAKEYGKIWKETATDFSARVSREIERYSVHSFEVGMRFLQRNSVPDEVSAAVNVVVGMAPEELKPNQKLCLVGRHAAMLLASGVGDDEALCSALFNELTLAAGITNLDGKGLYELILREGLMRDLNRR